MRSYYARASHIAQCVHVISIMDCLLELHWNNVAFTLYICACFICKRGSESLSHCEATGMMESGGSSFYASCGGGFM